MAAIMIGIRGLAASNHTLKAAGSLFSNQIFKMDSSSKRAKNGSGPAIYGLGFIGALIYFIQTATSFWIGVIGFLKALVWPAFLVYYLLEFLKK